MSEDNDKESKTEQPTQRRIDGALERGDTPRSREMGTLFAIAATLLAFSLLEMTVESHAVPLLRMFFDRIHDLSVGAASDVRDLFIGVLWQMSLIVLLPLAVVAAAGIGASLSQGSFSIALERIKPKASRLSPAENAARIYGSGSRIEFLVVLAKFTALTLSLYIFGKAFGHRLIAISDLVPERLPVIVAEDASRLYWTVLVVAIILAAIDVVWSRIKWNKQLRMSRQEVKDEQKQAEGDPHIRSRFKSIARARIRQKVAAAVPHATVVIANPTHYAVALKFNRGEDAVPIVIAKGVDFLALRIRNIAEECHIPVIEDRALARSLYATVDTNKPIPPDFYRAVAQIILFILNRQNRAS